MIPLNKNLVATALHDYECALEEINRPEHDMVTHSVCHLTREAICSLLRALLDAKGISFPESNSLDKLVQQSIIAEPALSKFDFSILQCSTQSLTDNPSLFCFHEAKVSQCFKLLDQLKNYIVH